MVDGMPDRGEWLTVYFDPIDSPTGAVATFAIDRSATHRVATGLLWPGGWFPRPIGSGGGSSDPFFCLRSLSESTPNISTQVH